jgi:hypothetical protein
MVREKVGWFQKFLGKIGKHYYWWRAEKMSAVMMTFDVLECLRVLIKLNDGNIEEALKDFRGIGIKAGETVAAELLGPGELIFSRSVEDLPFILKVAWHIFFGEDLKTIEFHEKIKDEPIKITWTLDHCIFCAGLKYEQELKFNRENMGEYNFGSVVAGAMEGAMNAILEFVESPYQATIKETKCIAAGDPFPEYTAYITEKE